MNESIVDQIVRAPIVPTVMPLSADMLGGYARALFDEGYPCLELLSRPLHQALEIFREIRSRPERKLVHWGIGTILTERAARQAVELSPDFLVSPAFSRRVLKVAAQAGIPYVPGVRTFQDVQDVLDAFEDHGLELRLLKLCPIYGLTREYVEALCGCYPGIVFCPTGEVTLENYPDWKQVPGIVAPMGSRFIPLATLERGDFAEVRSRLRAYRRLAGSSSKPAVSRAQRSARTLAPRNGKKRNPDGQATSISASMATTWAAQKPS